MVFRELIIDHYAQSKPGLQADLQATGFIEQHLSLPKPGHHDDRESLFKYEFKPKVCFAQDWFYEVIQNVSCGNTVATTVPKQMDIIRHQYAYMRIPGIIGVKGTAAHEYPYLVPADQCNGTTALNCVPVQERIYRDFETDPALEHVQDPPATITNLETAVTTATTAVTTANTAYVNALAALGNVTNSQIPANPTLTNPITVPGGEALADAVHLVFTTKATLEQRKEELAAARAARAAADAVHGVGSLTMKPFAHWVQGVGYRVIEKLTYDVGSQTMDTVDYRYIHAIDELHRGVGKRQTFQVGMFNDRESLIRHSLYDQELYVSLPLWYTHFIGISNMIVSQQLTEMTFRITLAELRKLIVCSDPLTKPFLSQDDGTDWAYNTDDVEQHDRVTSGKEVAKDSIAMAMLYNAYYLEEAERDIHLHRAAYTHERNAENQVVTKCQINTFESHGEKSTKWAVETHESVFEVIVTAQLESNRLSNNWFNLSRIGPDVGGTAGTTYSIADNGTPIYGDFPHEVRTNTPNADIITSIDVFQNNQLRFKGPAHMFRTVVPGEVHTNIPDLYAGHYIYCISWAVFPEDVTTYSGSVNTTRIGSIDIILYYHERAIRENKTIVMNFKTWGLYTMFSNVGGHVFSG